MDPAASLLLTDLYQLNMIQAYLERGRTQTAVFEFFVRKLPDRRGFLVAAAARKVVALAPRLQAATSLVTSSDAPALDCAYKLEQYAGLARRKHSSGKATWPGRKQAWRSHGADGRMVGDVLSVEGDRHAGESLLQPVMSAGRRITPSPTLAEIRARTARELQRPPESLRRLEAGTAYPVQIAPALIDLAGQVDRRIADQEGRP